MQKDNYIKFIFPVFIIVLWLTATNLGNIPETALPKLSSVKTAFVEMLKTGQLYSDLGISIRRVLGGYIISSILGISIGITMGTASVAVNKLTEKQFLERSRSNTDRRKVFVKLTQKGKVALNYHGNFHSTILERITDDIPKEKLDTFVEVFETIMENLDKVKKDIQPESILSFEKGDLVQVSSIKGSTAIRKYLNEKGVMIKSLIKIVNIDKYLITMVVDGDEKVLNVEDAENIMVRKNAL